MEQPNKTNQPTKIARLSKWFQTNEIVKAEKQNLTSVRTKILYAITFLWTFCIFFLITLFAGFMSKLDDVTRVQIMTIVADKSLGIFYVVSFMFFIMLVIYVLKRTSFSFKAFGIELDMKDNTTKSENINNNIPKQ